MQKVIFKFRLWGLKKLLNDDEKYLLAMAVDDRIDILERIAVNEKWANKEGINADCNYLSVLRKVFSSKLCS